MAFLASTAPVLAMPAHNNPVQSIAFNRNGRCFVTGDTARVLRGWVNSTPFLDANVQSTNIKVRATDRIRGMSFCPEGHRLYVACGDTLRAFDLMLRREVWRYQPPRSFGFLIMSPMTVAVSPAGNVLTVSDGGLVTALDKEGVVLSKWWDNEAPRHVSFLDDGTGIVGVDGFSVSIWEAYSGRRIKRMGTGERIYGMALDSLRQRLAIRTLHHVELIDALTLEKIDRVPAPSGLPLMAFSPDGETIALGGREEVLLLDISSKSCQVLPLQAARVISLAFHPAGTHLTAGCSDGAVRFWDVT